MKIIRRIADYPAISGAKTGLVPTMGALHEGHLSLMRIAKEECDVVAASIFVNPLQFGPNEDFSKYPRNESRDFALAEGAGVDILFCPESNELVRDTKTTVQVHGVTDLYEGAVRPGHFDGVATIVAKLFNIVQPQVAYFGRKDLQQCAVLRKMAEDLDFRIALRFMGTVREPDGLALSSRNAYLSPSERALAPSLYQALLGIAEAYVRRGSHSVRADIEAAIAWLGERGFQVDYLDAVDWNTMQPTNIVDESTWLVTAARLGSTRLIDSVNVLESQTGEVLR